MAGNHKVYDKCMKKAAGFVSTQSWNKAIKEYKRALSEFPEDRPALRGLGIAYAMSGQLKLAQEVLRKMHLLAPDDPEALYYLAKVEEELGEKEEATEVYLALAANREKAVEMTSAIEAWTRAAALAPEREEPYHGLTRAYMALGDFRKAAACQVNLAHVLEAKGHVREAAQAAHLAAKLDPGNEEARVLRDTLRTETGADQCVSEECGPIEAARQAAWSELARLIFEDSPIDDLSDTEIVPAEQRHLLTQARGIQLDRAQINAILGRAVDLDSQGNIDGAIQAYQQVLRGGVDRVAVHFVLGLLFREKHDFEDACSHLIVTTFHPDYALAAHLALGDCYQQHGRPDLAVQHYVQALKVADLQTVDETRALDIASLYGSLTDGYRYEGQRGREASIQRFIQSVRDFFRDQNWQVRALQLRQHLDALSLDGVTMSLAEGLGVPGFEEILRAMNNVQALVNKGLLLTAREECYRAIEKAPGYLPLHLRLADLCIRLGMIEEAVAKYIMVAQVYEVWRDYAQAINVYRQVLSLTPLDVKVRSTLIDLLINQREIDQAIEQYLALADAYYQQARVDKALEKFNEALRLTNRSQSEKAWRLKILYFMGDLYVQRVDWKRATDVYRQILAIDPTEDQASLMLMDLYFKQDQPEQALAELQRVVRRYEAAKDSEGLLKVLREAARLRPNEMAIRARLSQAYIELGMKQEAVAELDALGEMQLEAGLRDLAIQTIRLIISLKPANARAYKQLLYHLLS